MLYNGNVDYCGDDFLSIYVCSKCQFAFERRGEIQNCPDCGSENIRAADENEINDYNKNREEFEDNAK